MDSAHLFLDEIFLSLQGEGVEVGRPHLFLRLGGCPLRCTYCDTPRSWKRRSEFEVHFAQSSMMHSNPLNGADLESLLLDVLDSYRLTPHDVMLAVTGGEPLMQAGFLSAWLPQWPGLVLLETAGICAAELASVLPSVNLLSMDWKLANTLASGQELLESSACLVRAQEASCLTQVKLLLTENCEEVQVGVALRNIAAVLPGCAVFLQPVTPYADGPLPPSADRLLAWCIRYRELPLDLRVLPQVHPLLGIR